MHNSIERTAASQKHFPTFITLSEEFFGERRLNNKPTVAALTLSQVKIPFQII
jgi:hypothetical protein